MYNWTSLQTEIIKLILRLLWIWFIIMNICHRIAIICLLYIIYNCLYSVGFRKTKFGLWTFEFLLFLLCEVLLSVSSNGKKENIHLYWFGPQKVLFQTQSALHQPKFHNVKKLKFEGQKFYFTLSVVQYSVDFIDNFVLFRTTGNRPWQSRSRVFGFGCVCCGCDHGWLNYSLSIRPVASRWLRSLHR